VIRALAVLALLTSSIPSVAAAPTKASEPKLSPTASWWEKVTVTIAGDGKTQSCRYVSSISASKDCDVTGDPKSLGADGSAPRSQFTRLTFERRFEPGGAVAIERGLETGDTLLGRQVMALAIDSAGAVKGCRIVARSGDMAPEYGCKDAAAERFQAAAPRTGGDGHEGMMTILVYGHEEHLV
jgi:hypothetical protein